jgi:hypothetical protein
MAYMLGGENIGLVVPRQVTGSSFCHVFCSRLITEIKLCSHDRGSSLFPLYANSEEVTEQNLFGSVSGGRQSNISPKFMAALAKYLRTASTSDELDRHTNEISPEQAFGYIYAVLHSPIFRTRYVEFLKIDYPRVPLTSSFGMFVALARLGSDLVALHLLDSPTLDKLLTSFTGPATLEIEKVSYADDTVWIDRAQTRGFRGVSVDVWAFDIGGYQVCDKWLKDRKGRSLSKDDITHYQKIVVALSETIRLMAEIDKVIAAHGGWPGAFITSKN